LESEPSFVPHRKNKERVLLKKLILISAHFLGSEEKPGIKILCFHALKQFEIEESKKKTKGLTKFIQFKHIEHPCQ
jgi:hypothetical protein